MGADRARRPSPTASRRAPTRSSASSRSASSRSRRAPAAASPARRFCFTGALSRPRKEYEELVEQARRHRPLRRDEGPQLPRHGRPELGLEQGREGAQVRHAVHRRGRVPRDRPRSGVRDGRVVKARSRARLTRVVPGDEGSREEPPAVDRDEQEQLERQAHLRRTEHLHAEREEDVRDDHVDDEERQVEEEADREGLGELGRRRTRGRAR